MTGQRGAAALCEEPETVIKPGRQSVDSEVRRARRGELDCKRDAVEAATDSGDRDGGTRVRRKICRGAAGSLVEKTDGAVAMRVVAFRTIFRGDGERRYQVNPLV